METHATVETNNDASATVTDNGVAVSYDGTTKAEAGVSASNEYAEGSAS